jgi:hypothetical protein
MVILVGHAVLSEWLALGYPPCVSKTFVSQILAVVASKYNALLHITQRHLNLKTPLSQHVLVTKYTLK